MVKKWEPTEKEKCLNKEQLFHWDNSDYCLRLQNRWGTHKNFHKLQKTQDILLPLLEKVKPLNRQHLSLLEVGCGSGHFLHVLRSQFHVVYGLDYSFSMLQKAISIFNLPFYTKDKFKFIRGDCWKLPFKDNSFDVSMMIDVTMHIGNSFEAILELIRIAKRFVLFTGPSFEIFDKKYVMNKKIGKVSWAINVNYLDLKLKKMKNKHVIKNYYYGYRTDTGTYKHRVLIIEK